MANYNKKLDSNMIRIGEVRFSYAHVFEPRASMGNDPKYSCSILIPKDNTAAVKLVQDAIAAAQEIGKNEKWGGKIPRPCKTPLRDGDTERDDPIYAGHYFINATSVAQFKPAVKVMEGGIPVDALDNEDFYSGCYGAAVLVFKPFDVSGNRGVSAYLHTVVKTRDGEKLSGGISADDALADLTL